MSRVRDITKFLEETRKTNTNLKALRPSTTSTIDSAAVLVMKSASGMSVFSTLDSLPVTSLTTGQQAYVTETSRIYISNGNGWYNVAVVNATPSLTLSSSGTIALTAGAATTITMTATDSDNDNANLVLSLESGGDLFKFATVSQDSSVVTITPRTADSATALGSDGSATLTFKASDGVNQATVQNTFTLSFGPDWTATPTETILSPANRAASDMWGSFVEISADGNYVAVGAPYENNVGGSYIGSVGSVKIYNKSGSNWTQQQQIRASNQATTKFFSVPAFNSDGTYLVVGAYSNSTGQGSIYIFTRSGSTWTQQQEITSSDIANGDYFGFSVAMNSDGTYIAVGAYGERTGVGSVYVFNRSGSTWSQQAKIAPSIGNAANMAGAGQLSISDAGDYIAFGAPLENAGGQSSGGKAYIYTRSGTSWSEQASFTSSDVAAIDRFGYSIAINSDATYVVVGAYLDDETVSNSGSAYIFTRSGTSWSQQAKINGSAPSATAVFGISSDISSDGKYVLIGARSGQVSSVETGLAYVFERDGTSWSEIKKLSASNGGNGDYYGWAVALSDDAAIAVVGAKHEDGGAGDSLGNAGEAYIYEA